MNIIVNGKPLHADSQSLFKVLRSFGAVPPFAVAINGEFIPQSQHHNTQINEGDSIELLSPIQGG
jgi:sulfur carrier protein